MKILLDTNFLVDVFKFRIDLSELYDLFPESMELYVFGTTLNELQLISRKAKHGKYAKLALNFIKSSKIKALDATGDVDKNILSLDKHFVVATNDKKLRDQLKQKGMKTIYLRSRKHLAID